MTVRYSNQCQSNYQDGWDSPYRFPMNDILSEKDTRIIEDILTHELDAQPEQLTYDARIMEDFSADSLTVMEIIMAVEDRFSLSIPDERWEKVKTVGDLYGALAESLQEQRRC